MRLTAKTNQQLTLDDAQELAGAEDTLLWRIRDGSMGPEFLPGDSVYVSPRLAPQTGDVVVARTASGSCLFRRYKARGRKAFALIPEDKRWPMVGVNAKSPGEVVGVAFLHNRKMRPGGRPRSERGTHP